MGIGTRNGRSGGITMITRRYRNKRLKRLRVHAQANISVVQLETYQLA